MDHKHRFIQRILIFIPGLLIFYCYVFKCKLPLVYVLAAIQFTTHIYLMLSGKQCTPKTKSLCNRFAMLIGFIFTGVIIKYKLGIVPLLISVYMIISHIVTIYPLHGTFEYKDLKLPILNKNSYIFIFCDLFHENKLSKILEEIIKHTNGCVIDAGAYVGDSFLILSNKYPDRTFYMIEPSDANAKFIEKVKPNNVKVIRALLSDRQKVYTSLNENQPNASYEENTSGEINSITADDLIHEKVSILHYDVEGMELEVIKGSMGIIERDNPVIVVESLGKDIYKTQQIKHILGNMGYKFHIVNESCNALDIFDLTKCRNYIFIPQNF